MTTEQLDRKRSYGTVYGDPHVGFEQDGRMFRHDGMPHSPQVKSAIGPAITAQPPPPTLTVPATPAAVAPEVLKALEGISSQIKELKPDLKGPDPARSEMARRVWADRRAREAQATESETPAEPA